MHLGLTSLFSSVLSWRKLSPQPRKNRPARRGRRLIGEQLETRYALAGDVLVAEAPLLPAGQEVVPAVQDVVPVVQDVVPAVPVETPPLDPAIPGDGGEPDTGGENSAPVISGFTFSFQGDWLTVQGLVSDDQNPQAYLVELTGLLTWSVSLSADNHFSYTLQFSHQLSGSIFAQTQDSFGLFSNIAVVTL